MDTPRLYYAYGSNLHIPQMSVRCPTATPLQPFILKDWRLVFRSVADIEPSRGNVVMGALWSVLPEDELALDRYEGIQWGLYEKVEFRIPDGREAFMYLMTDRASMEPPRLAYYNTIAAGYEQWKFHLVLLEAARDLAVKVYGPADLDDDWMFGGRMA